MLTNYITFMLPQGGQWRIAHQATSNRPRGWIDRWGGGQALVFMPLKGDQLAFVNLLFAQDFSFEVFKRDASVCIKTLIGFDDVEDVSYSLYVTLDELPGGNDHELRFFVSEYDGVTDGEFLYFSAKDLAVKIPSQDRVFIRACLLRAIENLIGLAEPDRVYLCSYDTYAPPKADVKFSLIGEVFESKGYEVKAADPYNGQRVWWMNRR